MNSFTETQSPYRILRLKQVLELTGLSRSTVYELLDSNSPRHDPSFPKRIHLTACSVGWVAAEIDSWLESRITLSRQ
jgi:prophage regulatory protein